MSDDARPTGPRGSMALYGVAFVLVLAAGAALGLAARDFLREQTMLWVSIGLSAGAVALAVASLVLPRRR